MNEVKPTATHEIIAGVTVHEITVTASVKINVGNYQSVDLGSYWKATIEGDAAPEDADRAIRGRILAMLRDEAKAINNRVDSRPLSIAPPPPSAVERMYQQLMSAETALSGLSALSASDDDSAATKAHGDVLDVIQQLQALLPNNAPIK